MVQIPRYINVEVTGCIGITATFGCHPRPRHKEMSTKRILTSPRGHRGNGGVSPWIEGGGEVAGVGGFRSVFPPKSCFLLNDGKAVEKKIGGALHHCFIICCKKKKKILI